jgi:GntR family transcriptional regulator
MASAGSIVQTFNPLYVEVKRLITEGLIAGEWKPAEALPSETRLSQRFKVSIGTVRKAIDELVAENILLRRQGRGTFVAAHDERRLLFNFFHIVGKDGVKNYPSVETLNFKRSSLSADEAAKLRPAAKNDTSERALRIRNLLALNGKPVILDDIVIAETTFPGLTADIFRKRDNTIYQLYQTLYGINVVRTSERLSATLAQSEAASLLGVKVGAPLLEIHRVAYTYHGVAVELRTSLINTAENEYFSDLARPAR